MVDAVITGLGCVSPHGRGVPALWSNLLAGKSAFSPLNLFDASMFRNPLAGVIAGYPANDNEPARAIRMLNDAVAEALADALGMPSHSAQEVGDARPTAQTPPTPPFQGGEKTHLLHGEHADCTPPPLEKGGQGGSSAHGGDAGYLARIQHAVATGPLRHGAIVTGSNFGGMSGAERALVDGAADASKAGLNGYLFGSASLNLATRFGLSGPQFNLSLSCASGTAALGLALDQIRLGRAEAVLACGYDELSLFVYAGLSALRAITPDTIRPFDKRRKGTLFSEGAGAILVESAEHAAQRKAPKIYARLLGRAMNNDAYHMTAPEQEAHGIQAVMRAALADAKMSPETVDHANLHATGTPYNDAIETKALHAVFGARATEIPVCSVKSSIGHTMGAAGVIEAIAAVLSLRDGKVPPVLGLDPAEQDPACNLRVPTGDALSVPLKTILKTSYGFGGTNAAIVLASA